MRWFRQLISGYLDDPDSRGRRLFNILILCIILVTVIWFSRRLFQTPQTKTILIYCFSGMQEVMENGLLPAFQEHWLKKSGETVEYIPTFAGSGLIVDRIITRLPVDVAILSSEMDARHLSERGMTTVRSWRDLPNEGILCTTPLVLLVREGNPHQIADYTDLTTPGIHIIHPDPHSSGAGQWSILANYGAILQAGFRDAEAFQQLGLMWKNVRSAPASARYSLQRFIDGQGDVLIIYEANILRNPNRKTAVGQMVPVQSTILCEPMVLTFEQNIKQNRKLLVDEFVAYLWSDEAQRILVAYGFRSPKDTLITIRDDFGNFPHLFTIDSLGGVQTCRKNIITRFLQELDSSGSDPTLMQ